MVSGWIKLHRNLVKHWIWSFDEPDKALAWIDLIMHARHEAGDIMLKGQVVKLKRGDVAISQLALRKRWKWSKNKIGRFLDLLKKEAMVVTHTDHLTTIISICNYDTFQANELTDGPANGLPYGPPDGPSTDHLTDHLTDHDIRMKEGKKGKNKPPLPPKGKQFELPSSVDSQVWAEFEQHRKEIRKPLTDMARTKAANILKPLSIADQKATVDKSIQSRWTGLFPEKVNGHKGNGKDQSMEDWLAEANGEAGTTYNHGETYGH